MKQKIKSYPKNFFCARSAIFFLSKSMLTNFSNHSSSVLLSLLFTRYPLCSSTIYPVAHSLYPNTGTPEQSASAVPIPNDSFARLIYHFACCSSFFFSSTSSTRHVKMMVGQAIDCAYHISGPSHTTIRCFHIVLKRQIILSISLTYFTTLPIKI